MSISIPWLQELEREDSGRLRKAWATGYDAGAARAGSARAEGYEDGLAQGQKAAYEEGRRAGHLEVGPGIAETIRLLEQEAAEEFHRGEDAGYARGYNAGHAAGWKVGYRACQLHAGQLINNMRGGD